VVACAIAVALLPWILLHAPTILRARDLAMPFAAAASLISKYPSLTSHDIPQLWSWTSLFWGDSIASFNFVVLLCLVAGITAAFPWRAHWRHPRVHGLLSVMAAGLAVPGVYLWNVNLFQVDDAIRYSLSPIIAAAPIALLCLLKFSRVHGARSARILGIGACCAMLAVVGVFGKTLGRRISTAANSHTTLAYPLTDRYLDYCQRATSRTQRQQARAFQQRMEAGATVFVSASAPFQFDYSRNRILTVCDGGLINPALHFPAGIDSDALRRYLRSYGIRYVLFQRDGEGITTIDALRPQLIWSNVIRRKLADYGIYFRESMTSLAAKSETLFENDRLILFDLSKPGQ
jgi:hypothetical protein